MLFLTSFVEKIGIHTGFCYSILGDSMDIFYTDNTLYVNMENVTSSSEVARMKRRVFKILDDYSIDNIVLNIITDDKISSDLLDSFILEYNQKYNGKIIMKK